MATSGLYFQFHLSTVEQWGTVTFGAQYYADASYPVSFSSEPFIVVVTDTAGNEYTALSDFAISWGRNGRADALHLRSSTTTIGDVVFFAIGK